MEFSSRHSLESIFLRSQDIEAIPAIAVTAHLMVAVGISATLATRAIVPAATVAMITPVHRFQRRRLSRGLPAVPAGRLRLVLQAIAAGRRRQAFFPHRSLGLHLRHLPVGVNGSR